MRRQGLPGGEDTLGSAQSWGEKGKTLSPCSQGTSLQWGHTWGTSDQRQHGLCSGALAAQPRVAGECMLLFMGRSGIATSRGPTEPCRTRESGCPGGVGSSRNIKCKGTRIGHAGSFQGQQGVSMAWAGKPGKKRAEWSATGWVSHSFSFS